MCIVGHYAEVNGVRTYYEENDPVGNQTIVCIHIAGRESRQYHAMMDFLNGKYHMIAIDMPAHGKSWPLKGNRAISCSTEYADFIWNFTNALNLQNAVFMGCSLGGNIVFELAQRHPVYAIISLQGADYTPSISQVSRAFMNHPHVSLQHSHLDYSDSLIGSNPDPGARDFILWGVSQEIPVAKKADLTMYNGFDIRATMDKITCPVLLIRGEDDWIVDEASVQETISRITNAAKLVYKRLPGVGHFPAVEQPITLSKVIDAFLIGL